MGLDQITGQDIGAKINFSKEHIEEGDVKVKFISGKDQPADILTKAVPNREFVFQRNRLMKNAMIGMFTFCSILSIVSANYHTWTTVRQAIWVPTKHYVETNVHFFDIDLTFLKTCDQLPFADKSIEMAYQIKEVDEKYDELSIWGNAYSKCNKLYNEQWMNKVHQIGQLIPHRRGVFGDILLGAGGFAVGAGVSNLVSTFFA